jgi:hypothetical protein
MTTLTPEGWSHTVTRDLLAAYTCRAAALAVLAGCIQLAVAHQWLTFALLLWLAPSLLLVASRAQRAHVRTTPTRKDTTRT